MDLLELICLGGFAGVDLRTDSLEWIRSESDGNGIAGMDLTEWIGEDLPEEVN